MIVSCSSGLSDEKNMTEDLRLHHLLSNNSNKDVSDALSQFLFSRKLMLLVLTTEEKEGGLFCLRYCHSYRTCVLTGNLYPQGR
jgi:hypothetical protein